MYKQFNWGLCQKTLGEAAFRFLYSGFCASSELGSLILGAKPVHSVVLVVLSVRRENLVSVGLYFVQSLVFFINSLYAKKAFQ